MLHSEVFYAFLITAVSLTFVATLLHRAKIPTIVGFVLTGILIGPSGLNWIDSLPAAQSISELGIIFLMFAVGLEISLEHLKKMLRPLLNLGLTQVFVTISVTATLLFFALNFSLAKAFVLGSCLSLSSTAVIFKLLQDKRETETPYGRISIIILIFQDIAVLLIMAMIPLLASTTTESRDLTAIATTLGWILLFLSGCFIIGYYLIPKIFSEVTKTQSREVFFFSLISVTFLIAFAAEKVGLSMSLGAFIAGVLISESPYGKQAMAELSPLRDIFLGFFFASIGMMVNLDFIYSHLSSLAWLIPLALALKFFIVYFIVNFNTRSHGISFATALILTQIGEFSFIIAASAYNYQLLSDIEFQYFLSLAVCSLLFTPMMFSFGLRGSAHSNWPELGRAVSDALGMQDPNQNSIQKTAQAIEGAKDKPESKSFGTVAPRKTIVIGLGHAGLRSLQELTKNGIPCIGVDINLDNVKNVQRLGIEGIYGDSTRTDVLHAAGIDNAYLVVIAVNSKQITAQILAVAARLNPEVRVIVRVQYLQDLQVVQNVNDHDVIIAEVETAHALIHRALSLYNLDVPTWPTA